MVELVVPFFGSVIITLLLRRLDKSNVNLRKLKTLIQRGQKELGDIALQKKEELQDASAKFDLLLINSDKYMNELKQELTGLKGSLSEVHESRANLQQMDGELQSLEATTNSVKDQLHFINDSLDNIDHHQKKVRQIQDQIKKIDVDASMMVKTFQGTLDEKSDEAIRMMEEKLQSASINSRDYQKELRDELLEKHSILAQKMDESFRDLEVSVKNGTKGLAGSLEREIQGRFSVLNDLDDKIKDHERFLNISIPEMVDKLKDKIAGNINENNDRLNELDGAIQRTQNELAKKFESLHHDIESERSSLFQGFYDEAEKIRHQIHSIDLDSLAKKDDLIRAVKDEAGKIQSGLESFQDIYEHAKVNLLETAGSKKIELESVLDLIDESMKTITTRLDQDSSDYKSELSEFVNSGLEKINTKLESFQVIYDQAGDELGEVSKKKEVELSQVVEDLREEAMSINASLAQTANDTTNEFTEKLNKEKLSVDQKLVQIDQVFTRKKEELSNIVENIRNGAVSINKKLVSKANDTTNELISKLNNEKLSVDEKIDQFAIVTNEKEKELSQIVEKLRDEASTINEKLVATASHTINELIEKLNINKLTVDDKINNFDEITKNKEEQLSQIIDNFSAEAVLINESLKLTAVETSKELIEKFNEEKLAVDEKIKQFDEVSSNKEEQLSQIVEDIREEAATINEALSESVNETTNELIEKLNEEKLTVDEKMQHFEEAFAAAELKFQRYTESGADSVRDTVSQLESEINEIIEKVDNISEESVKSIRNEIQTTLVQISEQGSEVFQTAYKNFLDETKELQSEFNQFREQMIAIENSGESHYESLKHEMDDLKSSVEDQFTLYLKQLKTSGNELTSTFEQQVSGKLVGVSDDIQALEKELIDLRKRSSDDLDLRISPLFSKLGNVEKSLLDSQKQMINKWEEDSESILKKINEKEHLFTQSAEKWEIQFENLTRDARESVHKGSLEIEKTRKDMLTEFDSHLNEKVIYIENLSGEWKDENEKALLDIVSAFKLRIQDKEDTIFQKMQQISSQFNDMKKEMGDKQESLSKLINSEKSALQEDLNRQVNDQMQLFQTEVSNTIEHASQEVREDAEKYLTDLKDNSEKVLEEFKDIREDITSVMKDTSQESRQLLNKVQNETKDTYEEITSVQKAFTELKKDVNLLKRAEDSSTKIHKLIHSLEGKVSLLEDKDIEISGIFTRVEELKDLRIKLDSELNLMAQKREKVDKLEDQLQLILTLRDEIEDKSEALNTVSLKIEEVLSSTKIVEDQKDQLDGVLEEFAAQHQFVENVLQKLTSQEKGVDEISTRIETLNELLSKVDDKSNNLSGQVVDLENQMMTLKKHETEIEEVQKKFLEIEDLIEDIESRKQQIETLRKRFEELRHSMTSSVQTIEKIEHDAESKVRQLTDLVNAVDKESGKKPKANSTDVGDKKDMVLRLGEMGWSADEIAAKINMDLSSIQTILSSFSG